MANARIAQQVRSAVFERSGFRCEYCLTPMTFCPDPPSVEHIEPRSAGGSSEMSNLATTCQGCNNHKFVATQSIDPESGQQVPLYHPRRDQWDENFRWSNGSPLSLQANTAYTFDNLTGLLRINGLIFSLSPTTTTTTDPSSGQFIGNSAQSVLQGTNFQFQMLGNQINNIFNNNGFGGGFAVLTLPGPGATVAGPDVGSDSLMQLASFEDGSRMEIRAQNSPMMRGSWDGWVSGYGVGGNVQGKGGVLGIDYAAGGTQVGMYRLLGRQTLMGIWGAYGHQNVQTLNTTWTNINSGQMGVFLRRGDDLGNYYLLALMGSYDSYHGTRITATGAARGNFDGAQGGAYIERGWRRQWRGKTVEPTAALQYVRVEQNNFTETGAGANNLTVSGTGTDSLRTMVGGRVSGT